MDIKLIIGIVLVVGLIILLLSSLNKNNELLNELGEVKNQNQQLHEQVQNLEAKLKITNKELDELKNKHKLLKEELESAKNDLVDKQNKITSLNNLLKELEEKNQELKNELDEKNRLLIEKEHSLRNASDTITSLKNEVIEIENKINNYISWFRSNAIIPKNERTNIFIRSAKEKCVKEDYLLLPCLSFLIKQTLDFNYKHETNDKLYSITEMLNNYYGDCEDFSLLFKAIIKEFQADNYKLKVLGKGGDRSIIYSDRDGTYYYYPNTSFIELDNLGKYHIYMACYWQYVDYENNTKIGHCANLFTKKVISSSQDLTNNYLKDSYVIEPQNGFCISMIDSFNQKCVNEKVIKVCENSDLDCQNQFNKIVLIVTDNDFFIFLEDKWLAYSEYLEKIKEIEKKA
ncbi:MAG: hypothetical protein N3E37_01195 [Candidatus Micrarchaeota archaeon]|nr:hypothetical protein [Candidatus Micrarchaeota archaeon]